MYCLVLPAGIAADDAEVMAMETRAGADTVKVTAGLVTDPEVAVILEEPTRAPLAKPAVALKVVFPLLLFQVTLAVRLAVDKSE